ncbi:MAG: UpxY family transcription antiterminator [Cyclobacteriaceae bacterium]|nr:UpxY family transcription antiterminator [Cyclobacteriaceae bacterium]
MGKEKKWLVFYTASRQEKKTADYLEKNNYEVFLPMQSVVRLWSDRKKKVTVPLFSGYIFIKESEDQIHSLLKTPGIVRNIRHNNKPAVLREEEYNIIQRFLSSGYFIETDFEQHFENGEHIRIADGPFKNLEGTILSKGSESRFRVLIDSLGVNMTVTIDSAILIKH